ncbi:hypothetical protein DKZ26_11630 [Limosilactobacillus reuteri]|nr:hypothetical protein DKZ21_00120 [Limosilactobacillus reuteri]PWT45472.1 hypothetical protein DKZ25_00120 [Limosilactobacillus reuteri]PWT68023.1 hypothetical protein DKZ26_11630 [Limosilactobacillus reuteri]
MSYIVKNKAGTWFGQKIEKDGYKFDSIKEYNFYENFVKPSGLKFEVHKGFKLHPIIELQNGDLRLRSSIYTPDFVLYNKDGGMKHVIDIKSGFTQFAIDSAAALRFKLFADKYKVPVEVIVPRVHDFRVKIMGTTKKFNPLIREDLTYDTSELVKEAFSNLKD